MLADGVWCISFPVPRPRNLRCPNIAIPPSLYVYHLYDANKNKHNEVF